MMERAGEQSIRLALDERGERSAAKLRIAAALVVVVASVWLLALPYPVPRAFAVAGLLFSALWLARSLRQQAEVRDPAQHYLELSPEFLLLRSGAAQDRVPWPEVAALAVDEERLLLRVARRRGPPLEIEPRYQGLGLHALHAAVEAARQRARCALAPDD